MHCGICKLDLFLPVAYPFPLFQSALDLQAHTCEVLKSLMRSERNQQVMCEAGLPHELLTHCNLTLSDESHPLHPPIQYMFERLAAQCLTPKDLRYVINKICLEELGKYHGDLDPAVLSHLHT